MSAWRNKMDDKNISLSGNVYFIKATSAMAQGLFCSLLIGLIMSTIGQKIGIPILVEAGKFSMSMLGACIGASIAYALQAPPLVIFSCIITGFVGNKLGGPVGAYVATVISCELGKLVSKETKVDILVTPCITILSGVLVASFIAPGIDEIMKLCGIIIMDATELHPFLMGIVVSAIMGIILTLPISSAALSLMIGLGGLAGGAATVGCSSQMIGFAVASYRENKVSGLVSQGLGTSMLQIGNIVKNPYIWVPPTLTSMILGPVATLVFKMQNIPAGSGMGTSGLVGQMTTIATMGSDNGVLWKIALLHFILPAILAFVISEIMRKYKLIKFGDQKLDE
ncbi:MAG: PTS sugar transporter subunit IIC [Acholeplasmataceae bacterium]|nr:PTS sugar transporter subunit IIC [Acholeplasmataceae bacterium]